MIRATLFFPQRIIFGNLRSHSLQHKPLSSLLFEEFLRHVNFKPCKGISIRPRSCIHSENSLVLSTQLVVPTLSSEWSITLKSPKRRTGLLVEAMTFFSSTKKEFLLERTLGPYKTPTQQSKLIFFTHPSRRIHLSLKCFWETTNISGSQAVKIPPPKVSLANTSQNSYSSFPYILRNLFFNEAHKLDLIFLHKVSNACGLSTLTHTSNIPR